VKALRRLAIALVAVTLLCVAGTAAFLWHEGYRMYAVRTGSMTPTYLPGDLVIDEPAPATYDRGDVITFRSGDGSGGHSPLTTHRVNRVTDDGLQTKGDANETPDIAAVPHDDVVGRVVAGVKRGGYVVVFFQQPAGAVSIVTLLLSLILLWSVCFPADAPVSGTSAPHPDTSTSGRRRRRRGQHRKGRPAGRRTA
jgi:signal peptidase